MNIPEVTFSGNFSLFIADVKPGTTGLNESFEDANGNPINITVAAGTKIVRVSATNIELNILGQTLTGDFSFSQETSTPAGRHADQRVVLAMTNVSLGLGDGTTNFVSITNGKRSRHHQLRARR